MIKSSHVDQPLGSVLHGEVWLVAHHVVDEVEAVGRQGGGEHVLVVWRLQHHCHPQSGFFQRKGQKRVKEGREVTFMKECIGYIQVLDLSQYLGEVVKKSKWKFLMAFAIRGGGGLEGVSFAIKLF